MAPACEILGIDPRAVHRWRKLGIGEDQRSRPRTRPANRLPDAERQRILETVNAPEYRDLSPKQIVARLAD